MAWKVISGALTIIGVLTGLWTIHEARSGIAHTRGGTILRADSPQTFWFVIAIAVLWIAFCFFGAIKAWKMGPREPNV